MLPKILKKNTTWPTASLAISPRMVTDGMSKTMIVGEMAGRGYNYNKSKISGTWADGENIGVLQLPFSGPSPLGFPTKLTMDPSSIAPPYGNLFELVPRLWRG